VEPLSSRRVFDGSFIRIDVETWPSGQREVVRHPGACAVVAITPEGQILLVRQLREAVRRALLEIPAGILEEGETPEACAARELTEETGYRAVKLEHLATIYTSPGFTDERIGLFQAEAEPGGQATEDLEVVKLTREQAMKAIETGQILDAKTVAGLLIAMS
jgi:ADP-ribose pyrophosphatase